MGIGREYTQQVVICYAADWAISLGTIMPYAAAGVTCGDATHDVMPSGP